MNDVQNLLTWIDRCVDATCSGSRASPAEAPERCLSLDLSPPIHGDSEHFVVRYGAYEADVLRWQGGAVPCVFHIRGATGVVRLTLLVERPCAVDPQPWSIRSATVQRV
jgi:hypothetical protein